MSDHMELFELLQKVSEATFEEGQDPKRLVLKDFIRLLDRHSGNADKVSNRPVVVDLTGQPQTRVIIKFAEFVPGVEFWRHYTGRSGFGYELNQLENHTADYFVSFAPDTFTIVGEDSRRIIVLSDIDESEIEHYDFIQTLSEPAVADIYEWIFNRNITPDSKQNTLPDSEQSTFSDY